MEYDARVYGGAGNSHEFAFVFECLNCHTSGLQKTRRRHEEQVSGQTVPSCGDFLPTMPWRGGRTLGGKGTDYESGEIGGGTARRDLHRVSLRGNGLHDAGGQTSLSVSAGGSAGGLRSLFCAARKAAQKTEALSQFEALSLSVCQRKSGDKMWCGSCHDPHKEPSEGEKVAYYRGKCLSCHGEAFAAKHHADKPDCTHCHMPELPNEDVAHTRTTDHGFCYEWI